jgi:hypothetical protein
MGTEKDWSVVFRRSTVHPAVFTVREPDAERELVEWAREVRLVHRHQEYAFSAELDGWALLDGGLSRLRARSSGRLRSGLRIVGWSALRLVSTELGLVAPRRRLVGEGAVASEGELRRFAWEGRVALAPAERQAGLLVGYVDAHGLGQVADALAGRLVAQRPRTSWTNLLTSERSSSASPTRPGAVALPSATRPAG